MLKDKYLKDRSELLKTAQNHIDKGELKEMEAVKAQIEDLDNRFEAEAKAEADLAALENKAPAFKPENAAVKEANLRQVSRVEDQSSPDYETVFAKVALLQPLSQAEIEVFNKWNPENAYTHTTSNTAIVIPESVVLGIADVAQELHPVLAEVSSTRIKGIVKYVKDHTIVAGDADYYLETEEAVDEQNAWGEITLTGKELVKSVTVSWKLQAMAVAEFIPFLKRELGARVGAAKARAYFKGAGGDKYPLGVITALNAQSSKPQVLTYASTGLTYKDMTAAMAKLGSEYVSGAKIYANAQTVWGVFANLVDGMGRPLLIPDITSGGVGRIFGLPVQMEDTLGDGEVVVGNFRAGYKDNISEDEKLVTDDHAKARKTDFVYYTVHDGAPDKLKAFVYMVKGV